MLVDQPLTVESERKRKMKKGGHEAREIVHTLTADGNFGGCIESVFKKGLI